MGNRICAVCDHYYYNREYHCYKCSKIDKCITCNKPLEYTKCETCNGYYIFKRRKPKYYTPLLTNQLCMCVVSTKYNKRCVCKNCGGIHYES